MLILPFLFLSFEKRLQEKLDDLQFPTVCTPKVDYCTNDNEIKIMHGFEKNAFNNESVNCDNFLSWWKQYNKGVFLLRCCGRVVAGLDIWPVNQETYQCLLNLTTDETQLRGEINMISHKDESSEKRFWYIGGIILSKHVIYKQKLFSYILIEEALKLWLNDSNFPEGKIHICAAGYSKGGQRLLLKMNFKELSPSNIKHPIYELITTKEDLLILYENIMCQYNDIKDKLENRLLDDRRKCPIFMNNNFAIWLYYIKSFFTKRDETC